MHSLPRSIPDSVRREWEELERRRDGSSHADQWTAVVDWAEKHGAKLTATPDDDRSFGIGDEIKDT